MMLVERTSVGLGVHAHSTVGTPIDTGTGGLSRQHLGPENVGVIEYVRSLPGPVSVAYEAGPADCTLTRAHEVAGTKCLLAAPSKIRRTLDERVKTDKRDAEPLHHDANLKALLATLERRDDLVGAILRLAVDSEYTSVTNRLTCLRGISTLTGISLRRLRSVIGRASVAKPSAHTWGWYPVSTPPASPALRAASPATVTLTAAGS